MMFKISPWMSFYQALPDGRSWILGTKLQELPVERILMTTLRGRSAQALLLDKPFQLGSRVRNPGGGAFYLLRIRLRDLVGWPPQMAKHGSKTPFPGVLRCTLKSAQYKMEERSDPECVEFDLECQGLNYKAWQRGCPEPLLRSVEATLRQDGTVGKTLSDLQEMRLIGVAP